MRYVFIARVLLSLLGWCANLCGNYRLWSYTYDLLTCRFYYYFFFTRLIMMKFDQLQQHVQKALGKHKILLVKWKAFPCMPQLLMVCWISGEQKLQDSTHLACIIRAWWELVFTHATNYLELWALHLILKILTRCIIIKKKIDECVV